MLKIAELLLIRPQMPKSQRIRDPIHDLIEFGTSDFEQMAWSLLCTPEFQRLRRIKQLGFSELVFPGATHSRFAHSVGVFHTARALARRIKTYLGKEDIERAETAMAAALVHDLGHGPFSHSFESAAEKFTSKSSHEEWTKLIVTGDTNINRILETYKKDFSARVANIISSNTPDDIYASIVSSQFDADRLDYARRDRFMSGVYHGGFDFSWIMANLEVETIPLARDDETIGDVDALVLSRKAIEGAESYVLGLFHLYFTVYFHKTTRGAEKLLTASLQRLGELVKKDADKETGLDADSPLVAFIRDDSLSQYLRLDDFTVWGALGSMARAKDEVLRELAGRLINRDLYKVIDVTARLAAGGERAVATFKSRLAEAKKSELFGPIDVFEDTVRRDPYKRKGLETPEALSKVFIREANGKGYEDLRECSDVVKALEERKRYRVYVRNAETKAKVEEIMEGSA